MTIKELRNREVIKILFSDGNKIIDDYTLVAITIMIAESRPEEKEMMVKLAMNFLT